MSLTFKAEMTCDNCKATIAGDVEHRSTDLARAYRSLKDKAAKAGWATNGLYLAVPIFLVTATKDYTSVGIKAECFEVEDARFHK